LIALTFFEAFHGQQTKGINFAKQGVEIAEKREDDFAKGVCILGLGVNYYFADQPEEANNNLQQAVNIFYKLGSKLHLCFALLWLAIVAHDWQKKINLRY
jgi:hypothetical protein